MTLPEGRDLQGGRWKRNWPISYESIPEPSCREARLPNQLPQNALRLTLGMTCLNRNCLAVDPASGKAIYPASSVAVLLDTLSCRQIGYIQASTHSISCVNFSPDGQYIVLGELGHMPAVRVWSIALDQQVAEFQGHEYGVAYAAFSSKMDVLVSVGINQDGTIFVWSWLSRERISCNRFAEVIYAISFSSTDPLFVTCGAHHIRFWYPDTKASRFEPEPLLGRSAIMREIKTKTYVDITFGTGLSEKFIYSVTTCGLICKISSQRQIIQLHQLKNTVLTSVQASEDILVTASACGHVYFFNASSLQYRTSIAVPTNVYMVSQHAEELSACKGGRKTEPRGKVYLGLDNVHKRLTAILNNGDMCIWDINKLNHVQRIFFSSGHNKVIAGVDVHLSAQHDYDRHSDIMFSVSHDGTLRRWRLLADTSVCCEPRQALYTRHYNPRDPATCDTEVITVVKASQRLDLVVIGDSKGLVTVFASKTLQEMYSLPRHSRGVTIIMFYTSTMAKNGAQLMLTGGRDRLINVYDTKKDFQVLNTLSLHSGSIAALAMVDNASNLMLLSSALDRNVILSITSTGDHYHFLPRQCRHTTSSVVDIQVCPATPWAVLGRGNAVLTVIDTRSFKSVRTFRACANAKAQLEKLCVDMAGALLVTACSDRSINLMNLPFGLRLASFTGHATPVSGLLLTSNMRHLISSSRDGCIFLWQLPGQVRRRAMHLLKRGLKRAKRRSKKASSSISPIRSLLDVRMRSGSGEDLSCVTA